MTEEKFIRQNEIQWKALEDFTRRLNRQSIRKMPEADVKTFSHLFRLAGYHLAYAQTHFPQSAALAYLNRLVAVAHNQFYVRERGGLSDIKRYIVRGFPGAVRENARYWAAALALFMAGALFAFFYVSYDPALLQQLIPGSAINQGGVGAAGWDYPLMSAVIMVNNIGVAVAAFALGLFAGAGTVAVLLLNGAVLGGLTGFMAQPGGDMVSYFSLILPHGVFELFAIFLSGACGLLIGRAVLVPGLYTRRDALRFAAKKAAALIPGIVALLILAGLIEGFFTPLNIPPAVKLAFAGLTGAGLAVYLIYPARLQR